MRAFRHVPVVVFALGALACTAILGGFEVGAGPGAGLEGGTGEGGPPPGDAANDVSIDAPADAPVSCVAPRVGCAATVRRSKADDPLREPLNKSRQ